MRWWPASTRGPGPLAGPVVAAAVILDPGASRSRGPPIPKQLEPVLRPGLALEIRVRRSAWALRRGGGHAGDRRPQHPRCDAVGDAPRWSPRRRCPTRWSSTATGCRGSRAIVAAGRTRRSSGGDATVAGHQRRLDPRQDAPGSLMEQLDTRYPGYGFAICTRAIRRRRTSRRCDASASRRCTGAVSTGKIGAVRSARWRGSFRRRHDHVRICARTEYLWSTASSACLS